MLIAGLAVFLAGDVNAVTAARAVLGIGAALMMPLSLSVLPALFGPDERAKAVGMISAASALGMPLGFVGAGGPHPREPEGRHRLHRAHRDRARRPRLRDHLLAHRGFLLNTTAATLVMFVLSGLVFTVPTYLQAVLGHDAFATGLRLLPRMTGLMVAAKSAQPLVARFGARAVVSAGLVVLTFAALLGSRTTTDSGYGFTALWLSITGLGFGMAVVPAMDGALGTLPADRAGWGSPHAFRAVGEAKGCS